MFNCSNIHQYHLVYKTTNLVTGKYYIGIHSTNDIDDGYLGSGTNIKKAISKHGRENFSREIIATADTRDELLLLEAEIVNEVVVRDRNSYNGVLGGASFVDSLRQTDPEALREHQSNAGKKGARSLRDRMSREQQRAWHAAGGRASLKKHRKKIQQASVDSRSIPVIVKRTDGSFVGEYPSLSEAARQCDFDVSNGQKVMSGKAKQTKGFIIKSKS